MTNSFGSMAESVPSLQLFQTGFNSLHEIHQTTPDVYITVVPLVLAYGMLGVGKTYPYFARYNVPFFAQIFDGKIRMSIIHGYKDYIPWI